MHNNGIGERIRECREAAGLKRIQLAVAADVAANTIRNYEDGLRAPTLLPLRRIADALCVDLLWLIDGDRVGEEVA